MSSPVITESLRMRSYKYDGEVWGYLNGYDKVAPILEEV